MVPASLANGDYRINMTQGGAAVPRTLYLTVHHEGIVTENVPRLTPEVRSPREAARRL